MLTWCLLQESSRLWDSTKTIGAAVAWIPVGKEGSLIVVGGSHEEGEDRVSRIIKTASSPHVSNNHADFQKSNMGLMSMVNQFSQEARCHFPKWFDSERNSDESVRSD